MNHKRGKPKNARAGCIMCKDWKDNARKNQFAHQTRQEQKALIGDRENADIDPVELAAMRRLAEFEDANA